MYPNKLLKKIKQDLVKYSQNSIKAPQQKPNLVKKEIHMSKYLEKIKVIILWVLKNAYILVKLNSLSSNIILSNDHEYLDTNDIGSVGCSYLIKSK